MLQGLQMAEQRLNDCTPPRATPPSLRPVSRPSDSGSKSLKRKFLTGAAALSVSFVTPLPSRAVEVQAGYIATLTHGLFCCSLECTESLGDAKMNLAVAADVFGLSFVQKALLDKDRHIVAWGRQESEKDTAVERIKADMNRFFTKTSPGAAALSDVNLKGSQKLNVAVLIMLHHKSFAIRHCWRMCVQQDTCTLA